MVGRLWEKLLRDYDGASVRLLMRLLEVAASDAARCGCWGVC